MTKLRFWVACAAIAILACSKARAPSSESVKTACTGCHGGTDNQTGAPPRDLAGNTATTALTVGAHSAHVQAGSLAPALDCANCHVKPATIRTPTHGDGQITMAWSALATASGALQPQFDPATGKCSQVYCHGSFTGGIASNAPVWNVVDGTQAACGTCHMIPPPSTTGHPQRSDCGQCHGGYTRTSVNVATHVNGQVDVLPLACTACHGDPTRAATTLNPQLPAAPPLATDGSSSGPAVGAHQGHLQGGGIGGPFACTECHAVPANLQGHPNGTTSYSWGPLATGGGQTAPSYQGGACSATYCHGSTLNAGGTNHSPSWNGGYAAAACGTCHQIPPPAPHLQSTDCGKCHPGYTSSTVNLALHVNGQPDLAGLTCSTCHGDPTRTPTSVNPQLAAAPPVDTLGNTASTSPGVGAHQAHLAGGPLRAELPCTSCHVVPGSLTHATGVVELSFDALASKGLPAGTTPTFSGGTCSNVYCHGVTLGAGGTNHAPSWIGGAPEAACGTCHATPPPASTGHTQSTNCGGCHPGYTLTSTNPATHVNGSIEVQFSCTSCHGDPARQDTTLNPRLSASPPLDTLGRSDPTLPGVGAHQAHLQDGSLRVAMACTECHPVPSSLVGHPTGTTELQWGPLATGSSTTAPSYAGGSCSATYCHGGTIGAGGTNHSPSWTGGSAQVACGTCHDAPPPSPHPQTTNCGGCHTGYSATTVNTSTHVNGQLDVAPLNCSSCHGDPGRLATALNPALPAAPPYDTHGNSASTFAGVGAHQAHLQDGALRVAMACTECHQVPTSTSHPTGTVEFSWGPLATGAGTAGGTTVPSFALGSCSATYCHGSNLNAGGTSQTPAWTGGAPAAACGTCHGTPPPPPHLQNINCGGCHGTGYSLTTVNPATHVNGTIDLGALTCTSCHGDSTKTATPTDPRWAAPPVDTSGAASSAKVGAHAIHLNGSALSSSMACTQCHPVPTSLGHANGTTNFAWGTLATGAISATVSSPAFTNLSTTSPSYAAGTCSATYCHGTYSGTFSWQSYDWGSGTIVTSSITYAGGQGSPTWDGGPMTCGSCHGNPPAGTGAWHSGLHGGTGANGYNACQYCHPDASTTAGVNAITNPALHMNGAVDLAPQFVGQCFNCH